jgi:hypothetical protein
VRKVNVRIKDIGLLLLGSGVLLLALMALHFYVTEVLPHTGRAHFGAYCQSWDKNTAIITVNNYGNETISEANVYVDGTLACQLKDIPPSSSDICRATVDTNAPLFRVVAVTVSGKKLKDAGICVMYEIAHPVTETVD